MKIFAKSRLLASASLVAATFATTAHGQTSPAQAVPPAPAPAATPGASIAPTAPVEGEIIVTAQRRSENLEKTPVAVAVVSGEALVRDHIVSEQDLRTATPGLSVRASTNSNQLNYALRGQSVDAYSNARPGVLPYFNEIQVGGGGAASAFYDLQSVQVLKGPQGTLFGRSATGGAVLYTSAKPTDEFGGYVSGVLGNYNDREVQGAINVPIIDDKLMVRVAGFHQSRDGFQYNDYVSQRVGNVDRTGARLSVTAKIGAIRNETVVDYYHANDQNMVGVLAGLVPFTGGGTGNPPYIPVTLLYAGTSTPANRATGIGTLQAFTGASQAQATAYYDAYFADPRHPAAGLTAYLAAQNARGPYHIDSSGPNLNKVDNVIVSNITSLEIAPNTTLRNIFGYTNLDLHNSADVVGTPYAIAQITPGGTQRTHVTQTSEELQVQGKALAGRLSYTTGFYYSVEHTLFEQSVSFFDILFGGESQHNATNKTNTTFAGYAQGTYALNDQGLAFTVGARYTSEKARLQFLPNDSFRLALGATPPPGYSYDQSATYNRLSWQFGVQDQVNSNLLFYAVSRRAYKSGGFNGIIAPQVGFADTGGDAYRAERLTDAELGGKFSGRVGDIPVRANVALYYDWVSDSQRTAYTLALGNPSTSTVNVPSSHVYGLELDGQIQPVDPLTLGATFNYTHAVFSDGSVFANGVLQTYDQVTDTPKTSGSIFANLRLPINSNLTAIIHGEGYYQDKSFTSALSSNNYGTVVPSYVLANFRVGVEGDRGKWAITANLKNAFNRVYYAGALPTGEIAQYNVRIPGDPRTFTVEARFKF